MAQAALCAPIDLGPIPDLPPNQVDGCAKIAEGGYGQLQYDDGNGWQVYGNSALGSDKATQITNISVISLGDKGWQPQVEYRYAPNDDLIKTGVLIYSTPGQAGAVKFRIDPTNGDCEQDGND